MKSRFVRSIVEHSVGHPVKLGDIIEYPFRGRKWKVVSLDETHVTLED